MKGVSIKDSMIEKKVYVTRASMPSYEDYVEAITSEGYSFDDFDVESIVNRNKQCYINYFEKLKKVPFDDYKPYLWNMSNEFINDVRAAYANE